MKPIAKFGTKDLQAGFQEFYQQVHGKAMGNPMALTGPNGGVVRKLDDLKPKPRGTSAADAVYLRYWKAIHRDALYSTAGPVFAKAFGVRQAGREISDIGSEQQQAGATK